MKRFVTKVFILEFLLATTSIVEGSYGGAVGDYDIIGAMKGLGLLNVDENGVLRKPRLIDVQVDSNSIELQISAYNLDTQECGAESNPKAIVTIVEDDDSVSRREPLGETEILIGQKDPQWKDIIKVDFDLRSSYSLRFTIYHYHSAGSSKKMARTSTILGQKTIPLVSILQNPEMTILDQLKKENGKLACRKVGKVQTEIKSLIRVTAREIEREDSMVAVFRIRITSHCAHQAGKGYYIRIEDRKSPFRIYESQNIDKPNSKPRVDFIVPKSRFFHRGIARNVTISVFTKEKSKSILALFHAHRHTKTVEKEEAVYETTLDKLIDRNQDKPITMVNTNYHHKQKSSTHTQIEVKVTIENFSFTKYINEGMKIHTVVAIDWTLKNVDYRLHHGNPTEYEVTMHAVLDILKEYNTNQQIYNAYVFGIRSAEHGQASNAYPLELAGCPVPRNWDDLPCHGIKQVSEVIKKYRALVDETRAITGVGLNTQMHPSSQLHGQQQFSPFAQTQHLPPSQPLSGWMDKRQTNAYTPATGQQFGGPSHYSSQASSSQYGAQPHYSQASSSQYGAQPHYSQAPQPFSKLTPTPKPQTHYHKYTFSGCGIFSTVIRKTIEKARQANSDQSPIQYFFLLIMTAGGCHEIELEDTIRAIIDATYLPISIIIAGIGDDKDSQVPFKNLIRLDGDDKLLTSPTPYALPIRDIVQFVHVNGCCKDPRTRLINRQKLAAELLKELPAQFASYVLYKQQSLMRDNPKKSSNNNWPTTGYPKIPPESPHPGPSSLYAPSAPPLPKTGSFSSRNVSQPSPPRVPHPTNSAQQLARTRSRSANSSPARNVRSLAAHPDTPSTLGSQRSPSAPPSRSNSGLSASNRAKSVAGNSGDHRAGHPSPSPSRPTSSSHQLPTFNVGTPSTSLSRANSTAPSLPRRNSPGVSVPRSVTPNSGSEKRRPQN